MTVFELVLVATVSFPVLGAIGSLIGVLTQRTAWGLACSHLGLGGGSLSAAFLAVLLLGSDDSPPLVVTLPAWAWLTIPRPRQLSLEFGFEATWIRSTLASLIGFGILMAVWTARVRKRPLVFENVQLTNSLLYAAVMGFLFAPNLAQSLLGWGVISLLLSVLIRIASGPGSVTTSSNGMTSTSGESIRILTQILQRIGGFVVERLGRGLAQTFPCWVGEQFELIEESPITTQLLAVVLCSSAVLLTWLIVT